MVIKSSLKWQDYTERKLHYKADTTIRSVSICEAKYLRSETEITHLHLTTFRKSNNATLFPMVVFSNDGIYKAIDKNPF